MKKYILLVAVSLSVLSVQSQCFPDRHSTQWQDAWYSCDSTIFDPQTNDFNHWIQYDFGSNHFLGKIQIWNFNASPSGLGIGVKKVRPFFSTDGTNWTEGDAFELDMASGFDDYEGQFTSNFNVQTRYVHLSVVSNHGNLFCAGLSHIRFFDTPGSVESEIKLNLKVYPNPSQGGYNVQVEMDSKEPSTLKLTNAHGAVLRTIQLSPHDAIYAFPLDLTDFPDGLYFLSLEQGGEKKTQKLMKVN